MANESAVGKRSGCASSRYGVVGRFTVALVVENERHRKGYVRTCAWYKPRSTRSTVRFISN